MGKQIRINTLDHMADCLKYFAQSYGNKLNEMSLEIYFLNITRDHSIYTMDLTLLHFGRKFHWSEKVKTKVYLIIFKESL